MPTIPAAPGQDCPSCGKEMLWKYLAHPLCPVCEPPGEGGDPGSRDVRADQFSVRAVPLADTNAPEKTPAFEREHDRYIVVKTKDCHPLWVEQVRRDLSSRDADLVECVVVEPDWPMYDRVWLMVECWATGQPMPYVADRDVLLKAFRAWVDDQAANPGDFHSSEEFENRPPAERAEHLADQLLEYLEKTV